ncbi:hypothetical protein [Thermococcus sp. JCM 11816]|uniref:hypothetical protein n=1 Tax=Thermococcus sp. (strain JCM 11816 / KS-1) TaxID=1295125 RepID=UPI003465854F
MADVIRPNQAGVSAGIRYDKELLVEAIKRYLRREGFTEKELRLYTILPVAVFFHIHPEETPTFDEIMIKIYEIFGEKYGEKTRKNIESFLKKLNSRDIIEIIHDVVPKYSLLFEPRMKILEIYLELEETKKKLWKCRRHHSDCSRQQCIHSGEEKWQV